MNGIKRLDKRGVYRAKREIKSKEKRISMEEDKITITIGGEEVVFKRVTKSVEKSKDRLRSKREVDRG